MGVKITLFEKNARMKKFLLLALFALCAVNFTACDNEDDHDHGHEHSDVMVMITSPEEDQMVMSGSELHIHADLTSEGTIHNLAVTLTNETTNETQELFNDHVHQEGSYTFMQDVTLTATDHTDYMLSIATTDHDGEPSGTAMRHFHVMP